MKLEIEEISHFGNTKGPAKTEDEASKKSYQFWSTQPVPSIDEMITTNEAISPDLPNEKVRQVNKQTNS